MKPESNSTGKRSQFCYPVIYKEFAKVSILAVISFSRSHRSMSQATIDTKS
ncbi:MAG: hypothetical protein RIE73_33475 [Coleofasciculus sp. C1-SOL-03]